METATQMNEEGMLCDATTCWSAPLKYLLSSINIWIPFNIIYKENILRSCLGIFSEVISRVMLKSVKKYYLYIRKKYSLIISQQIAEGIIIHKSPHCSAKKLGVVAPLQTYTGYTWRCQHLSWTKSTSFSPVSPVEWWNTFKEAKISTPFQMIIIKPERGWRRSD